MGWEGLGGASLEDVLKGTPRPARMRPSGRPMGTPAGLRRFVQPANLGEDLDVTSVAHAQATITPRVHLADHPIEIEFHLAPFALVPPAPRPMIYWGAPLATGPSCPMPVLTGDISADTTMA